MDYDLLVKFLNWIWLPLSAAVGWLFKRLSTIEEKADTVNKDLNNHKIHVAQVYVTRPEHLDVYTRFDGKLDRILDKLDQKQDK
tara:strand:- start:3499 stop:3750 length:252 start_codon:yes stop_codon:yes gene_type:complete